MTSLQYLWQEYNKWDATSVQIKSQISKWRVILLTLIIASALFSILSHLVATGGISIDISIQKITQQVLSGLSAGGIALAAYFGGKMLSASKEKQWLKARSVAEAFKSESFLYLMKAAPYHLSNPDAIAHQRITDIAKRRKDIQHIAISEQQLKANMPSTDMSFDDYITKRVNDQKDGYYRPKALEYQQKENTAKMVGYLLGTIGAILALLPVISPGFSSYTSIWVAFITTISGALASYFAANRYEYLIVAYQSAADKLELILTQWGQMKSDTQRRQFVLACEQIIITENNGWMAEFVDTIDDRQEDLPK